MGGEREKEIFTVITNILLVMVLITLQLVKLHPEEHCSSPGSQASSKNRGSLRVTNRREPLNGEAES